MSNGISGFQLISLYDFSLGHLIRQALKAKLLFHWVAFCELNCEGGGFLSHFSYTQTHTSTIISSSPWPQYHLSPMPPQLIYKELMRAQVAWLPSLAPLVAQRQLALFRGEKRIPGDVSDLSQG